MSVDAARNLTITASAKAWMRYIEEVTADVYYLNLDGGTLSAETTIQPINLEYNVTTNALGAWNFTQNGDAIQLPKMQDDPSGPGQKRLILKQQNESGDGLEVKTSTTGSFFNTGHWNYPDLIAGMTDGLAPVAQSIWAMYQADLLTSLSSLNTQIVMPVGNIFTFNGLSIDKDNHLYTLIKYQTQSGKGEVKDVVSAVF